MSNLKVSISRIPGFRYANMIRRGTAGAVYVGPRLLQLAKWIFASREDGNFTYDLTDRSIDYLAHTIANVTHTPFPQVVEYIDEARYCHELQEYVVSKTLSSLDRERSDAKCLFGRRLGWYALTRILKPSIVVETGIDKGLGSVLLCYGLLRNRQEGFDGKYYGLDINQHAGWLLGSRYEDVGTILYGDAIESLKAFSQPIDLFINDSDHSADYEYQEYRTIAHKLSPGSVILGDNSHCTNKLSLFSEETNRDFIFFREDPLNHWYSGGGIGISFERDATPHKCELARIAAGGLALPRGLGQ
jgi:predicted O-methyltransferase YrrM